MMEEGTKAGLKVCRQKGGGNSYLMTSLLLEVGWVRSKAECKGKGDTGVWGQRIFRADLSESENTGFMVVYGYKLEVKSVQQCFSC